MCIKADFVCLIYLPFCKRDRYEGIDFRKKSAWYCNNKTSPVMREFTYDGVTGAHTFATTMLAICGKRNTIDT